MVVGAAPGLAIDRLESCRYCFGQRGPDIGDLVADVVKAGSAALEKSSDRGIGASGGQEFDLADGAAQKDDLDALGVDNFAARGLGAGQVNPGGDRFVDGSHGDPYMIENSVRHGTGFRWIKTKRRGEQMSENGATVTITDENFGSTIEGTDGLAMVDFWAAWCGPCRMVAPIVEELATDYEGKLTVGKLDVDSNQRTATRFNVRSIPSILFFKDGKLVDTIVGAVPKPALQQKIEQHL